MFVLSISFLNGTYHATPWGKHVNEGIAEWPPSSWRLLRAIIAVWKTTLSELKDEEIWPILKKLVKNPPNYYLPDASVSHTRHYMPKDGKETNLVMNTFVITGRDNPVYVIWNDVNLSDNELKVIEKILKNLHYFGRSESWCKASIMTSEHPSPNCIQFDDNTLSADNELVRVLVPKQDISFVDISKQKPKDKNLSSITITTKELQEENYIDPPGGKFTQYIMPRNCFNRKITKTRTSVLKNITVIRYRIVGSVKPLIKDTLRVGDLARTACMSKYGKANDKNTSGIFSGKDGVGKPLKNHIHASYLPTYEMQDRQIDHLTIFTLDRFDEKELDVLFSLKKIYGNNQGDINLVFEDCGDLNDFSDVKIFKKNHLWKSTTPLILTRHMKSRGKGDEKRLVDSPEAQIRNEIESRYGASYELKNITITENKISHLYLSDFFRWRNHGSVGDGRSYNVELEFKNMVSGPITLGYASHYGLGMFAPKEKD